MLGETNMLKKWMRLFALLGLDGSSLLARRLLDLSTHPER